MQRIVKLLAAFFLLVGLPLPASCATGSTASVENLSQSIQAEISAKMGKDFKEDELVGSSQTLLDLSSKGERETIAQIARQNQCLFAGDAAFLLLKKQDYDNIFQVAIDALSSSNDIGNELNVPFFEEVGQPIDQDLFNSGIKSLIGKKDLKLVNASIIIGLFDYGRLTTFFQTNGKELQGRLLPIILDRLFSDLPKNQKPSELMLLRLKDLATGDFEQTAIFLLYADENAANYLVAMKSFLDNYKNNDQSLNFVVIFVKLKYIEANADKLGLTKELRQELEQQHHATFPSAATDTPRPPSASAPASPTAKRD